ncbi:hypothetical protein BN903_49 [Halorubrum sp. AJ67]|nr:hypothetical protein BN903_49 [Halorubrum sp. AJ67]
MGTNSEYKAVAGFPRPGRNPRSVTVPVRREISRTMRVCHLPTVVKPPADADALRRSPPGRF